MDELQQAFYVYRFSFYKRDEDPPAGADFGAYARVYQDLPCCFESTPETDEPTAVGRNKEVNIFTMDLCHAPINYDFGSGTVPTLIDDAMYCTMTSGPNGTPDIGAWWAVEGGTRVNAALLSGKQVVYIKKAEQPVLS